MPRTPLMVTSTPCVLPPRAPVKIRDSVRRWMPMRRKILDALKDGQSWIDSNPEADAEEIKEKHKEVEGICAPIVSKYYGAGGGGGGAGGAGDEDEDEAHDEL